MDVTQQLCKRYKSFERMVKMLNRHGLVVVVSSKGSSAHQATPQSHGNFGDVVHPSGDVGFNRKTQNALTEMFRNEYLLDSSSPSRCWNKQDTLNLKNLFRSKLKINLRSCSREADLYVRQTGQGNPLYLGTMVATQVYNSNSCKHVLWVAKLNLFSPEHEKEWKEIKRYLPSHCEGDLWVISRNSQHQWLCWRKEQ